jgi:hypothetical protein
VLGVVAVMVAIGIAAAIAYALAEDEISTSTVLVGSGVPTTVSRSVPPFGDVELAGSNNVTIRLGQKQSVSVHGDDNLVDPVTTHVESGTLVIDNEPGTLESRSPMRVEVSMPSLSVLTLSGSGTVKVVGMDELDVTVTLSGSGVVRAQGSTYRLTVTVIGSGQAELSRLVAGDVVAVVAGSGEIRVTATKSLVAAVPGRGSIVYGGNPDDVTTTVTGVGAITER